MRSRYKFVEEEGYYFITTTIIEWIPIFTNRTYFEIIKNCLEFCEKSEKFKVHGWVILENHCHFIISGKNLIRGIQSFKSFTAKEIVAQLAIDKKEWCLNQLFYFKKCHKIHSKHQIWQEGVHPQFISSEEVFWQKMDYIHYNPVKRGYVENPEDWIYSSARNFLEE